MPEMTRRETLKIIAAAGIVATGCTEKSEAKTVPVHTDPQVVKAVLPLSFPWQTIDPFLFCVHHDDAYPKGNAEMGPAVSLAGRRMGSDFAVKDGWRMYHGQTVPGFPQHPHRGFETVTVVRRGLLDHSDSLGAKARYGQGDVQWLTTGKGVQHSEMFPLLEQDKPNPVELFQIWLNLPQASKMVDPHFKMLWNATIPRRTVKDAQGRATRIEVIAGQYGDAVPPTPPPNSWASQATADVAIWTLKMAPGAQWVLPAAKPGTQRALYFFKGKTLKIGARTVAVNHRVDLIADHAASLEAGSEEVEILMLQGRPIGEPVARRGPFVMNTQAEIRQTFVDYRRTRFGGWPWPSLEPVHGREGRFAKHPDGREERPT